MQALWLSVAGAVGTLICLVMDFGGIYYLSTVGLVLVGQWSLSESANGR